MEKTSARPAELVAPKGLVVDDDETWQHSFSRYLEEAGLIVSRTSSLSETESLLDQEFFHVALVDLSLVGSENRDGLKILTKIYQELREGTEAILLTAYGGLEVGAEANSYGAFKVFEKGKQGGLNYREVVDTIKAATEKAKKTVSGKHLGLNLFGGHGFGEDPHLIVSKMIHTLGKGYQVVDKLITEMLTGLAPFLVGKGEAWLAFDHSQRTAFMELWSKMLGTRIGLLLSGDPQRLAVEESKLEESLSQYRRGPFESILRKVEVGGIGGVVMRGKPTDLQAFQKPRDVR